MARHQFQETPKANIQRSSFNRSHMLKTTFDASSLIPIFCDEVLPGDTFNLRASLFGRLATPQKPIMDNLYLETFFFFVPNRLVWDNWEKFCGAQDNPGDSTDFSIPTRITGSPTVGGLYDYFGLPTGQANIEHNILPFRAYNLIYNEWFRDQNLQDSLEVETGDTNSVSYNVQKRNKRFDYFTQALPWPQKGDPVSVPLGDRAPIATDITAGFVALGNGPEATSFQTLDSSGANLAHTDTTSGGSATMYADLASATGFTINQLRQSFQIQKLLERDARGGTRYAEITRSHFGVVSPDARLQRPEFLGGGSTMINVNPVAQTQATIIDGEGAGLVQASTAQGNLAAFGTVSAKGHGFTKSFTEHGYIIGLVNVRADLTYQQGLHRMWNRRTRYDFYWPALAHIGEQAVLSKEIYFDAGDGRNDEVFGYVPRYDEYRYKPSQITGLFRSSAAASLDVWHLAQEFENRPVLDSSFISEDVPLDRVIAVPDEPHFLLDAYFNLRCVRPMPTYGVPGLIDHF